MRYSHPDPNQRHYTIWDTITRLVALDDFVTNETLFELRVATDALFESDQSKWWYDTLSIAIQRHHRAGAIPDCAVVAAAETYMATRAMLIAAGQLEAEVPF